MHINQNQRIFWLGGILLSLAAFLWLVLVLPYLPGPSMLALPINKVHYIANLGVVLIALCAVLIALGAGLFGLLRRNREMVWQGVLLFAFAIACFLPTISESWLQNFARQRAIRNAQPILFAIETYKSQHGELPASITELRVPLKTNVIGIAGYAYKRVDDEFELSFLIDEAHFNWERVMYRPSGQYKGRGELPTISREGAWGYYVFD